MSKRAIKCQTFQSKVSSSKIQLPKLFFTISEEDLGVTIFHPPTRGSKEYSFKQKHYEAIKIFTKKNKLIKTDLLGLSSSRIPKC